MQKLILTRGLPASGKSTWAKTQCKGNCVRINRDEYRWMLTGASGWHEYTFKSRIENLVTQLTTSAIFEALDSGFDVVVDETGLNPAVAARLEDEVLAYQFDENEVQFVIEDRFLAVPVEECIRRDAERGVYSVGEDVIRKMAKKWL